MPTEPISSVRQRLQAGVTLSIAGTQSAGAITANRNTGDGWRAGLTQIVIDSGSLALAADQDGVLTIDELAVDVAPIDIPRTVIGDAFQLTEIRFFLAEPVRIEPEWATNDEAHASFTVALKLSWSLTRGGVRSRLGSPDLPPVPVELVLFAEGSEIRAELHAIVAGELWNWGDMIRLDDFDLRLAAGTVVETR